MGLTAISQRGKAATECRNVSRKDAKGAKKTNRKFSELGVLSAPSSLLRTCLAGEISESKVPPVGKICAHRLLAHFQSKIAPKFEEVANLKPINCRTLMIFLCT
jgi:hypothetical protein